jgi:predicted phosphodiesterase
VDITPFRALTDIHGRKKNEKLADGKNDKSGSSRVTQIIVNGEIMQPFSVCYVRFAARSATFARRMWASLALSAAAAMQIAVACRGNRDSSVKT